MKLTSTFQYNLFLLGAYVYQTNVPILYISTRTHMSASLGKYCRRGVVTKPDTVGRICAAPDNALNTFNFRSVQNPNEVERSPWARVQAGIKSYKCYVLLVG